MIAIHCDEPSCDAWISDQDISSGFLKIIDTYGDDVGHFCCLDHVIKWAVARSEPIKQTEME